MSTEELLKPRYKVIANYPYSPYKIGDIVDFTNTNSAAICEPPHYNEFSGLNEVISHMTQAHEFDDFPALFKGLKWWEDRDEKDMPHYVSYLALSRNERVVQKVTKWNVANNEYKVAEHSFVMQLFPSSLPATEQDYKSQLQNK